VKAFVVKRNGMPLDLAGLQQHCAHYLADYKKPRSIEILAALPKNAGGKTMKSALVGGPDGR
jgi:acyl-coenzyme A synthetase/AMP-(fatty) acid ligase